MTLLGVDFAEPWWLLALLLVPVLAWRVWALSGRGRVLVPAGRAVSGLVNVKSALWWLPDALRILAVVAMVVALARPRVAGQERFVGEGVDIMLALDMSSSMNAIDMTRAQLEAKIQADEVPHNRFEVARDILKQFIVARNQQERDRIGLVIFGQQAWLKYPLTHDHARLVQTMNQLVLDLGMATRDGDCINKCTISGNGTAIGDALGRSYNQLRRSDGESRIIILITDGKQQGGSLDARAIANLIAERAGDERVRVYTFLVGGQDEVWQPDYDRWGRTMRTRDLKLSYSRARQPFSTDPELLAEIARKTGGQFYESYNEEKFREDIQDLERRVFSATVDVQYHDVFFWPLLVGLLLIASEWLLRFSLFRSVA